MEWIEITAKTLEEAKDQALDALGIDASEAEFEILEEPKPGLFGRTRGEARVRARVVPMAPPPKVERRDRRKGSGSTSGGRARQQGGGGSGPRSSKQKSKGDRPKQRTESAQPASTTTAEETSVNESSVSAADQAAAVGEFLEGLTEAFGVDGKVVIDEIDDETVEVRLVGDDLGIMIGSGGATLSSIHELAKVVVQRRFEGRREGRFRLDIGEYRARRREALAKFAAKVAAEVLEEGEDIALEPMGAADRKVVHDAINEIDGVSTRSEGEEPRRRIVITCD